MGKQHKKRIFTTISIIIYSLMTLQCTSVMGAQQTCSDEAIASHQSYESSYYSSRQDLLKQEQRLLEIGDIRNELMDMVVDDSYEEEMIDLEKQQEKQTLYKKHKATISQLLQGYIPKNNARKAIYSRTGGLYQGKEVLDEIFAVFESQQRFATVSDDDSHEFFELQYNEQGILLSVFFTNTNNEQALNGYEFSYQNNRIYVVFLQEEYFGLFDMVHKKFSLHEKKKRHTFLEEEPLFTEDIMTEMKKMLDAYKYEKVQSLKAQYITWINSKEQFSYNSFVDKIPFLSVVKAGNHSSEKPQFSPYAVLFRWYSRF